MRSGVLQSTGFRSVVGRVTAFTFFYRHAPHKHPSRLVVGFQGQSTLGRDVLGLVAVGSKVFFRMLGFILSGPAA